MMLYSNLTQPAFLLILLSLAAQSGVAQSEAVESGTTQTLTQTSTNKAIVAAQAIQDSLDKETLKLLKIFRAEFIDLKPGDGKFPGSMTVREPKTEKTIKAKLVKPFSVAKYEVTQNLWRAVMGSNPSRWKGERNSVEMLDFGEAIEFTQKVTDLMRKAKLITPDQQIRLPTEIEWEYATRAGTDTKYSFGDEVRKLDEFAWHTGNAAGNDPPVGAKKPNPWGIYDSHGYLWEFCIHSFAGETPLVHVDPAAKPGNWSPVLRGGSWKDPARKLESRFRMPTKKDLKDDAVGLRCILIK